MSEQTPESLESTQSPEVVFTELMDQLESTRNEHGAVTFGSKNTEYGDQRAVVLPEPVIDEEGNKKIYVAATAGGPKGLVFEKSGESFQDSQVDEAENRLRRDLSEIDKQGGSQEKAGGYGMGYHSPPQFPRETVRTGSAENLGLSFYRADPNDKGVHLTEVNEDTVVKAYDTSKEKRTELPKPQSPEVTQQNVRAANALMQRLGPKPQ